MIRIAGRGVKIFSVWIILDIHANTRSISVKYCTLLTSTLLISVSDVNAN